MTEESHMNEIDDFVVVVPGIQGSQLWRGNDPIWVLNAKAMWNALKTLGGSIKSLQLPPSIGDDDAPDGVEARGLMPDLHGLPGFGPIIRGYSGLTGWLEENFTLTKPTPATAGNLLEFAYDWRLSNRNSAQRLKTQVETEWMRWKADGHPSASVVFLCHSMGGLVARYYLEALGGAEITRALVTFGTPHRGAADAVIKLVNGVKVGKGPVKVDVSALGRSLPSTYQLLPTYRCVNTPQGLQSLTQAGLPGLDNERLADAAAFHKEIGPVSGDTDYLFRMVVGTRQPTWTTVGPMGRRVKARRTIEGTDERGDGTVPRLASIPEGVRSDDLQQLFSAQTHGWLHLHHSILDDVHGILTSTDRVHMGAEDAQRILSLQPEVTVPEFSPPGATLIAEARSIGDELLLWAELRDIDDTVLESKVMENLGDGRYRADLSPADDGICVVTVRGEMGSGIDPISTAVTVADVEDQ